MQLVEIQNQHVTIGYRRKREIQGWTIFDWFKKWQFAADVGAAERLRCLLVLVGKGRFVYPHQQEKLIAMAAEWNGRDGRKRRDVVNLNWLADTLAQHVEEPRGGGDYERFCNFTGKSSRDA